MTFVANREVLNIYLKHINMIYNYLRRIKLGKPKAIEANEPNSSSVRLLESGSGTLSTELLGLASSGVGDDEVLVVLKEYFLEFSL